MTQRDEFFKDFREFSRKFNADLNKLDLYTRLVVMFTLTSLEA